MRSEVEEFKRLCGVLSLHRQICTGEELDMSLTHSWPSDVSTETEFGALVSKSYMLWRETWMLDIGFLRGPRRAGGPIWDFDDLIYKLRTAQQHSDNREAVARSEEWVKTACGRNAPATYDEWAVCGRALMLGLNVAIERLCKLAAAGRRDTSFRQAWLAKVSESVESIVSSVVDDLGMHLDERQRQRHVREVERRWKSYRLRRGETAAEVLASFAERSLVSAMDRLPCDHQQVLDELGVLGSVDASAVLRLAHTVAEISGTSGETFVKLVGSTWASLRFAGGSSSVSSAGFA